MDFKKNIPIYIQIMEKIKEKILIGELKPNDKIPSVRALSEEYNVNQNTIQRVCSELLREEILYTQRGIGSFVTEKIETIEKLREEYKSKLTLSYIDNMKRIGFSKKDIINFLKEEM